MSYHAFKQKGKLDGKERNFFGIIAGIEILYVHHCKDRRNYVCTANNSFRKLNNYCLQFIIYINILSIEFKQHTC